MLIKSFFSSTKKISEQITESIFSERDLSFFKIELRRNSEEKFSPLIKIIFDEVFEIKFIRQNVLHYKTTQ